MTLLLDRLDTVAWCVKGTYGVILLHSEDFLISNVSRDFLQTKVWFHEEQSERAHVANVQQVLDQCGVVVREVSERVGGDL